MVEGKVKNTGEIHLSVQAQNGVNKSGQPPAGGGADAASSASSVGKSRGGY